MAPDDNNEDTGEDDETHLQTVRLLAALTRFEDNAGAESAEVIESVWEEVTTACGAWSEALDAAVAARVPVCPEAEALRLFIGDCRQFVVAAVLPRLIHVARRRVAGSSWQGGGPTFAKAMAIAKEKIFLSKDAWEDLNEDKMSPDPDLAFELGTSGQRVILTARDQWRQALTSSSNSTGRSTLLTAITSGLRRELGKVDAEARSWQAVAAEVALLCERTLELMTATTKFAEALPADPAGAPDSPTLMQQLARLVEQNVVLLLDFLAAVRMHWEDESQQSSSPAAATSDHQHEHLMDEYEEMLEDLVLALEDGDVQGAKDTTSDILDHTMEVLERAESLATGLSPTEKSQLIETVEKLFTLTERQTSNAELVLSNRNNALAMKRLEAVNAQMLTAVADVVAAMQRIDRGSGSGGGGGSGGGRKPSTSWVAAFGGWRLCIPEYQLLCSSLLKAVGTGATVDSPVVAGILSRLTSAMDAIASSRVGWASELSERLATAEVKVQNTRRQRQSARESRQAEYELAQAQLARERLAFERDVRREAEAELARQQRIADIRAAALHQQQLQLQQQQQQQQLLLQQQQQATPSSSAEHPELRIEPQPQQQQAQQAQQGRAEPPHDMPTLRIVDLDGGSSSSSRSPVHSARAQDHLPPLSSPKAAAPLGMEHSQSAWAAKPDPPADDPHAGRRMRPSASLPVVSSPSFASPTTKAPDRRARARTVPSPAALGVVQPAEDRAAPQRRSNPSSTRRGRSISPKRGRSRSASPRKSHSFESYPGLPHITRAEIAKARMAAAIAQHAQRGAGAPPRSDIVKARVNRMRKIIAAYAVNRPQQRRPVSPRKDAPADESIGVAETLLVLTTIEALDMPRSRKANPAHTPPRKPVPQQRRSVVVVHAAAPANGRSLAGREASPRKAPPSVGGKPGSPTKTDDTARFPIRRPRRSPVFERKAFGGASREAPVARSILKSRSSTNAAGLPALP